METCNVPVMPTLGVTPFAANISVPCNYEKSAYIVIADGYQKSIGFSSLFAFKGDNDSLVAVKLTNVTEDCISISKRLGQIYGAPYKNIERSNNYIIYYI